MANSLSQYFISLGAKRLSEVEINPKKSNQHELNGTSGFKKIFGLDPLKFTAKFIYLSEDEDNIIENTGELTWYDARENHATRTEHRLYYTDNQVIPYSSVGDLIIVARTGDNTAAIFVAQKGSTSEKQLLWLFDLDEVENKFIVKDLTGQKSDIGFAGKYIISSLGIEIEEPQFDANILIQKFGSVFPSTNEFSAYARSIVKDVSVIDAPDETLIAWLEKEELLFRTLESIIVKERLKAGFGKDGTDVDEFISFSLSVQNRRKSRAGHSFENHLAVIFDEHKLLFDKGKLTERNNKPDFVFPKNRYHSPEFNIELLTMLGVKTTAKDRWRQVLSEADKIPYKHLITLEPSISRNQTEEMRAQQLQLVVPKTIIPTYLKEQQEHIINLGDFIKHVYKKQSML
ncbi:type II restriction endonuclease [Mucilaginibacter sp. R-33]|uniref:type II restriction endonuclease n=1 Tax=unclassified Mucilaginibacter TaxID=2617802 RepID=UPI003CF1CAF8